MTNDTQETYAWWAELKHGGLLISPSQLRRYFPASADPLPDYLADRLRRDLTRFNPNDAQVLGALLDTVLEDILGLDGGWLKGAQVPPSVGLRLATGENLKPRRLWQKEDFHLPVFVDSTAARLGIGRGKRPVARMIEWQRKTGTHLALITNGRQWRLIHVGADYEAWAEWDTDFWFNEGKPGPQVTALRTLLGPGTLTPAAPGERPPLLAAVLDSRHAQAELSSLLGERVREAVELLIRAGASSLENIDPRVLPRDIYIAAVRAVMRLVVILFAEARELLPRDLEAYHASYGLQGLRESLDRSAGTQGLQRLRHRYGAWPRVVGLWRLIYYGSSHQALPIPAYGGALFTPGQSDAPDPILRALAALESTTHEVNDAVVHKILDFLCRCPVRVRQGGATVQVEGPVDFSDLSSEYIGILYEGLLDYELRRADGPVIFLSLGDQPALPLERLEAMDAAALKKLLEKSKEKSQKVTAGEEEAEEAGKGESQEGEEAEIQEENEGPEAAAEEIDEIDEQAALRERAHSWALRAVTEGGLVGRARGTTAAAQRARQEKRDRAADGLVARLIPAGDWYLVRWGGTRKGAGTFYTRPQLAVPTTIRTLMPLAYDEAGDARNWVPKRPEEILKLKVCDPAMGSGSFLLAALRFLTDALYASLHYHNRIGQKGDGAVIALAEGKPANGGLDEETVPVPLDDPDFEDKLKAKLKRHIVERCLYGVDIDPLAVELGRLSLWVETMDRELPFGFLDHKIKVGNSLVGCWFDRFSDYPLLAWLREGGDANHNNGVHFAKEAWTKAIKATLKERVKPELVRLIEARAGQTALEVDGVRIEPQAVHDEALAVFQKLHSLPMSAQGIKMREKLYRDEIIKSPAYQKLKEAFDIWCAAWFWPADQLGAAPTPAGFVEPTDDTRKLAAALAREHRFFHWELEFPDVFTGQSAGFDAVIGNPPWEIQKSNSKEYFTNHDPIYRALGKQEAIRRQTELFADETIEHNWLTYSARFKALSNWNKYVAHPFGDGKERGASNENLMPTGGKWRVSDRLHGMWHDQRRGRGGYTDAAHPFLHQGSADINTYKMFLEAAHALIQTGGRLGMITPSGLYTDKGATDLRRLFLERCQWAWLFGFENRRKIFDIHRSFKFCPVIIAKGGRTDAIKAAFMRHDLADWETPAPQTLAYPSKQIEKFSPNSRALLEIRNARDLEILEKIYDGSVLLGDQTSRSWQIKYATEFHMTNDSKLFPPIQKWLDKGYKSDPYGRWIGPDGDIALPLYQGVMIWQFDFSAAGYVSGAGNRAQWRPIDWENKVIEPQFLMDKSIYAQQENIIHGLKVVFRPIARTTDTRTMIGAVVPDRPCGHSLNVLSCSYMANNALLLAIANSFTYDFQLRVRLGGTNISQYVIFETSLPPRMRIENLQSLRMIAARLAYPAEVFAHEWWRLAHQAVVDYRTTYVWQSLWAVTPHERLRLRCILDAVVAELYGLDLGDLAWILRDCDYPADRLSEKGFAAKLDPKGFWRVDKAQPPELRHTTLTLKAFERLKEVGLGAFCAEDWQFPKEIADQLGPRFYDWQLEGTPEESWAQCEQHARNILGEEGFEEFLTSLQSSEASAAIPAIAESRGRYQAKLVNAPKRQGQMDLFDD